MAEKYYNIFKITYDKGKDRSTEILKQVFYQMIEGIADGAIFPQFDCEGETDKDALQHHISNIRYYDSLDHAYSRSSYMYKSSIFVHESTKDGKVFLPTTGEIKKVMDAYTAAGHKDPYYADFSDKAADRFADFETMRPIEIQQFLLDEYSKR